MREEKVNTIWTPWKIVYMYLSVGVRDTGGSRQ